MKILQLSLSTQVALSLLLGLAAGLFFGEDVAFLQDMGRAFILLLQMTVLPYIILALITGLGRLTYQQVATLALRVGAVLVLSWGLAFAAILVMPLAFPVWESAAFFSTSLVETPEPINFITLFIPSNPFFAPLPRGDRELADFINMWLDLKRRDRTIQSLYDYWILGKNAVPPRPRWSVMRNVLHWVE
jgi:Na+/H+-dicarboxylate symporter